MYIVLGTIINHLRFSVICPLTTGADNIVGTSGNDIINGVFDTATAAGNYSTLNLADSINGGTGTNTLALRYATSGLAGAATISASTAPVLTNIQVLQLTSLVNSTVNLTALAPDLTTLNLTGPVGTTTVTGASTKIVTFGLSNVAVDHADVAITLAAGRTGTADAITLNLSGASSATTATANTYAQVDFTGAGAADGIEIINVVSTGTANRLDTLTQATATTLKTINISGSANFRVNTALANTVKTIDASTATGNINLGVAAGDNLTFTGGSGNDRINMALGLTTDDVLNGGTGTNTLAIGDVGITATKTNALNKAIEAATNFQKLEMTAAVVATDTVPISVAADGLTAIKTFVFTGGGTGGNTAAAASSAGLDAVALSGFGSTNTNFIEIGATYTGGAGIANGSGTAVGGAGGDALQVAPGSNSPADETTITLSGFTLTGGAGGKGGTGTGGADGGIGGYGIYAADFETINLVSTGSTATAASILAGGVGGAAGTGANAAGAAGQGILVNTNAVIKVTGANDLTFTTQTVNPVAGGVQVDALTFTGKLNVVGTIGNDIIKGGTANDTIQGSLGRDTIDLTAGGKDKVVLTDVLVAANRDTISGFTGGASSDTLNINNEGTSVSTVKAYTGTANAFTLVATDNVVLFNFAATNNSASLSTASDGAQLLKGIANQGSVIASLAATASDKGYIVAYDATDAYLFYYDDADGGGTVVASEVALIGTLSTVAAAALVASNFV